MPHSSYFLIASIPQPLLAGLNPLRVFVSSSAQNSLDVQLEKILSTNTTKFIKAAKLALSSGANYVEWRADSLISNWPDICLNLPILKEKITKIYRQIPYEISTHTIFTWRGVADKGGAFIPPSVYQILLNTAAKQFAYVDVEANFFNKYYDSIPSYTEFLSTVPLPKRLISMHIYNHDDFPVCIPGIPVLSNDSSRSQEITNLFSCASFWETTIKWLQNFPAAITKLAVECQNPKQITAFKTAVTQVLGVKSHLPLIAVVMGEHYAATRVELAELGGWGTFAIAPGFSATAPGQQTIEELIARKFSFH